MASIATTLDEGHDRDDRVFLRDLSWEQLEAVLAIRGDQSGVRLAYLEGSLELMSPSKSHERIKKLIARLVEAYAEENGLRFDGYGSLTMKNPTTRRAAEPDECYIVGGVGGDEDAEPNLVIEVIWTSGGLDKRSLYVGLGIAELWEWHKGRLQVLTLRGDEYLPIVRSALLPALDLDLLARHVGMSDQTAAVKAFRKALQISDGR